MHKALRGDGEALLGLVECVKPHDHIVRHLYLTLAEFYLPDGPLKNKAHERKVVVRKEMNPEFHDQADKAVQAWKKNIQEYKAD